MVVDSLGFEGLYNNLINESQNDCILCMSKEFYKIQIRKRFFFQTSLLSILGFSSNHFTSFAVALILVYFFSQFLV